MNNLYCIKCKNRISIEVLPSGNIDTYVYVGQEFYFHNEFSCEIHKKDNNETYIDMLFF